MILQTLPLSGCYGKQNVFSFFVNPVIVLVFCLFLKKETNKKTFLHVFRYLWEHDKRITHH